MNSTDTQQQVGEVQGDARAQFEAWAKSAGLETKIYDHNDMYSHPVTRGAWMAWQQLAARQPGAQVPIGRVEADADASTGTRVYWNQVTPPVGTQLYAAPPAQGIDMGQFVPKRKPGPDSYEEDESEAHYSSGWNDCRGAMLALIDQRDAAPGVG